MGVVFAVTGAIGAGKTTIAARLAAQYGALLLSSDDVRLSLSRKARRSGENVFAELHRRFERALEEERNIVLDSTGMSFRFRALLHAHRAQIVHLHLILERADLFEQREAGRSDRPQGALPVAAFVQSQHLEFFDPPDVVVLTDDLTAEQVYESVLASVRQLFNI